MPLSESTIRQWVNILETNHKTRTPQGYKNMIIDEFDKYEPGYNYSDVMLAHKIAMQIGKATPYNRAGLEKETRNKAVNYGRSVDRKDVNMVAVMYDIVTDQFFQGRNTRTKATQGDVPNNRLCWLIRV